MLKHNANARTIEYDSHIDVHVEWESSEFDAARMEPCGVNAQDVQVYHVVQKDMVSFEKIARKSKKWLGKITV